MSIRIAAAFFLAFGLLACERAQPSVVGSWVAPDAQTPWTVDLRADSTFTMQVGTLSGEGSYTAIGEGPDIRLEVTGRMADVMPGGYQATVENDTLRLCSVAGCTNMVRAQP